MLIIQTLVFPISVSKYGYGCKTENSFENGEELDINDVATDDVQEILTEQCKQSWPNVLHI